MDKKIKAKKDLEMKIREGMRSRLIRMTEKRWKDLEKKLSGKPRK